MNLISEEYLNEQIQLHTNPNYGVASTYFAPLLVEEIIPKLMPASLCDYGAGKCRLLESLRQHGWVPEAYFPYDPAFPNYGDAKAADLVVCIDVLEHVEPELVRNVILDLKRVTKKYGFFSIHTGPAAKTLRDGRNAHLIQEQASWWLLEIAPHFEVLHLQHHNLMGNGFWVVVEKKTRL